MTIYLNTTKTLLIAFFLLPFTALVQAQEGKSIFDQMNYTEVLDVTILTDLDAISNKRSEEKHKATFTFTDADGVSRDWEVKLTIRGKFRRMRCTEIPPLKIDFDKDDLREAGLTKFDDLKLVNQCVEDKEVAKELLLKEYLAYKMYNKLTPESFRVQFLNITYTDVNTGSSITRAGFFIEDAAQLRDRIGADKVDQDQGFQADQFNATQFKTMALFQYWIGNSDWSAIFGRNIKVLEKDDQLIAIPYDFDFSGMVDAPYAVPNMNYGLTSIKERAYMGYEKEAAELEASIEQLVAMRDTFKKLVKGHKLLNRSARNETWSYLNDYFKNPREINFGKKEEVVPTVVQHPITEHIIADK